MNIISRVLQGLITGIGFVGGGAILKEGASVRGTATAASIWNAGVIGASVALGHYGIAFLLALLNNADFKIFVYFLIRINFFYSTIQIIFYINSHWNNSL